MIQLPRMKFYVTKTEDGLIHVQNFVGGLNGQHHVHGPKGYQKWLEGLHKEQQEEDLILMKGTTCDCGLGPGDVRSHDGHVTYREEFK